MCRPIRGLGRSKPVPRQCGGTDGDTALRRAHEQDRPYVRRIQRSWGVPSCGFNAGLANPAIKARLAGLGGSVMSGSPADFGKLIAVGKVVKFSGAKVE
jgi:hypothetical protein